MDIKIELWTIVNLYLTNLSVLALVKDSLQELFQVSLFATNNAFSINFWIASVLIDKYKNKSHPLDSEDVFVALMCVLVGGFGAG